MTVIDSPRAGTTGKGGEGTELAPCLTGIGDNDDLLAGLSVDESLANLMLFRDGNHIIKLLYYYIIVYMEILKTKTDVLDAKEKVLSSFQHLTCAETLAVELVDALQLI
jgi:hypothetical protein